MAVTSLPARPRRGSAGAAAPRLSTKARLIGTGERLFGLYGFDGISLREIAAASGQRNCNAVQYHFKSKAGFIRAILEDRLTRIDILRGEALAELQQRKAEAEWTADDLLRIMWLPTMAIVGEDGGHSFCRFSLQFNLKPDAAPHPFYDHDVRSGASRPSPRGAQSHLFRAAGLLRSRYPLSDAAFFKRITALSMMFLCSVVEHDNLHAQARTPRAPYEPESILRMALGALAAPE
jgi:AcrR family transcriptional regulator